MSLLSPRFRNSERLRSAATNAPPLRQGESSDGVRLLQEALVDLGHEMPRSEEVDQFDGIYGPETTATVRDFQKKHGLVADGIAGAHTLEEMDKIFSLNDSYYGDAYAEQLRIAANLQGTRGSNSTCCATARKSRSRGSHS